MGGHYYDKQGNPRHDATMREVKKEDLLISVTTYIGVLDKPGLSKWKIDERLKIAFELLKSDGSLPFIDFIKAVQLVFDERNNASDIGTMAHDLLDEMVTQAIPENAARDFFYANADKEIHGLWNSISPAYEWFNRIVKIPGSAEKTSINLEDYYAGRIDYTGIIFRPDMKTSAPGIIDWKSQNVKRPGQRKDGTGLLAAKVSKYPEWALQLGAYSKTEKCHHGYIGVIGTNPLFPYFNAYHYDTAEIVAAYKTFRYIQEVYNYMHGIERSK